MSEQILGPATATESTIERKTRFNSVFRTLRYLFSRTFAIALTIFIGVFITVVLANQGKQIDAVAQAEVEQQMRERCGDCANWYVFQNMEPADKARVTQIRQDLETAAGLNLPYWPRQVRWTLKALAMDWHGSYHIPVAPGSTYPSLNVKDIILTDLPHTLLLVGSAYLLLFSLGLPLALRLSRKRGSRLDRFFSLLAPISSIPSWVLGMILILIFAVRLQLLPVSGMYDPFPATTPWGKTWMVMRHMVLPVIAILASLFFQYVYTWRTMFLVYADEDYVDLGRAKGLPDKILERRYILRPTLPFIITNFALIFITFWQMTIVLEKVFNWPGIGRLYIVTLPNFFGERMYPGVMPITLSLVVLFAYILGVTVLILDILYALVDPRVRIGDKEPTLRLFARQRSHHLSWLSRKQRGFSGAIQPSSVPRQKTKLELRTVINGLVNKLERLKGGFISAWREIARFPSAVIGIALILLMALGSLYAVLAFPYNQIAEQWYARSLTGKTDVPKLAMPIWSNWFRKEKLPPTIIMDSRSGTAERNVMVNEKGIVSTDLTFRLNYDYGEFPQNLVLYFYEKTGARPTFVSLSMLTPDGREIDIGRTSASNGSYFDFLQKFPAQRLRASNQNWKKWTGSDLSSAIAPMVGPMDPIPGVYLLFADPDSPTPKILKGTYTLRAKGIGFEEEADLNAELVVLGQIYGPAGTDIRGRDLLLPLLWGMPFALVFGLLGALVTTILSMGVAATGVWLGGGVDSFIQRLVEVNMILPVIAIGVLIYSYFNVSIWVFLWIVVLLNVFGSPTKSFRAALLQLKDAPYLEAARAYGATNTRIIVHYLIPRMLPILIPQLVILIPSYVFLEATLGFFNIKSNYPTWGSIIYDALRYGTNYGSSFWVLEPIAMLLLTAVAFSLLGFGLERILNPRMRGG